MITINGDSAQEEMRCLYHIQQQFPNRLTPTARSVQVPIKTSGSPTYRVVPKIFNKGERHEIFLNAVKDFNDMSGYLTSDGSLTRQLDVVNCTKNSSDRPDIGLHGQFKKISGCCVFQHEGVWYRGLIAHKTGNRVRVFAVDFGWTRDMNAEDLHYMRKNFVITPMGTVRCALKVEGFPNFDKDIWAEQIRKIQSLKLFKLIMISEEDGNSMNVMRVKIFAKQIENKVEKLTDLREVLRSMSFLPLCRAISAKRRQTPCADAETQADLTDVTVKTCPICIEKMTDLNEVRVTSCYHGFHLNCISTVIETGRRACPVCRSRLYKMRDGDGVMKYFVIVMF